MHKLTDSIRSIKQYFFINHGDVFTHFLDMAKLELGKKKKRIMLERLQTQLDLALRNPSSRVDDDPFKDDLKIVFEDVTVAEWLLKIVNQTGAMVGPDGIPIETFDEVKKDTNTKAAGDIMGKPTLPLCSIEFEG
jgi:gamma-tubulin complex component 2